MSVDASFSKPHDEQMEHRRLNEVEALLRLAASAFSKTNPKDKFPTIYADRLTGLVAPTGASDLDGEAVDVRVRALGPVAPGSFGAASYWILNRWHESGEPTFVLSGAIAERLLNTDIKSVDALAVRLPYPAIRLEIPVGLLALYENSGARPSWHNVDAITAAITRRYDGTPVLLARCSGRPARNASNFTDDYGMYVAIPLRTPLAYPESHADTALFHDDVRPLTRLREADWFRVEDEDVSRLDFTHAVAQLTLNTVLYLTLEHADVVRKHARKKRTSSKRARSSRRAAQREKERRATESSVTYLVGSHSKRLRSRDRSSGTIGHEFIVRGHYRQQAHGKGYSLRKLIWIEPYLKGTGERLRRTYQVQG